MYICYFHMDEKPTIPLPVSNKRSPKGINSVDDVRVVIRSGDWIQIFGLDLAQVIKTARAWYEMGQYKSYASYMQESKIKRPAWQKNLNV